VKQTGHQGGHAPEIGLVAIDREAQTDLSGRVFDGHVIAVEHKSPASIRTLSSAVNEHGGTPVSAQFVNMAYK